MAYITYLTNQFQTNACASHAGWGRTKEESQSEAQYWHNQLLWVKTVPASKAPKWAVEEAREAYHRPCLACSRVHPTSYRSTVCVDAKGYVRPIIKDWPEQVKVYEF